MKTIIGAVLGFFIGGIIGFLVVWGGGFEQTSEEIAIDNTASAPMHTNDDHGAMSGAMDAMTGSLEGKQGDDFDRAFINEMIVHHEGAVAMAELAKQYAGHAEIKTLADAIIAAQTAEIAQMQEWRKNWFEQNAMMMAEMPAANATTEVIAVGSKNFSFFVNGKENPDITVKEGDIVRIEFTSDGGFHDFVIDEFSAATEKIQTGGKSTVEFVANKKGSFEYYCSVGSHREMGMKGRFIVE